MTHPDGGYRNRLTEGVPRSGGWERPIRAVLATVLASLMYAPLQLLLWFLLNITISHITEAPGSECADSAASCADPNDALWICVVAFLAVLMIGGVVGVGMTGEHFGNHAAKRTGAVQMMLLGAVVTVVTAAAIWRLFTSSTY